MSDVVFWTAAALLLGSALGVVLARSLWRAAYCLAAALLVTAVLYLALSAPLVAAVQVLLYTGGVLTLVAYALVVTARPQDDQGWRRPAPAALTAALVLAVLLSGARRLGPALGNGAPLDDGRATSALLFTAYLVPFELLSLLLLGAIFGALAIARREDRR